jgi:hypothetical protein
MRRQYDRNSEVKPFVVETDADDVYKLSHAPKYRNAEQFIEAKLIILSDFCIGEEKMKKAKEHLYAIARESEIKNWSNLKTEEAINRAVRQIIMDKK